MNKVFAVLSLVAVASVSAFPFTLDFHHKLAVVHPAGVVHGEGAAAVKLRFLHLMPKAAHAAAFAEGFACGGKKHDFLGLAAGHHVVELVGLADCKEWHAVHLTVWTGTAVEHKAHAFAKAAGATAFAADAGVTDLDALVDFVHGKLTGHVEVFKALLKAGVPAHLLVLKLHAKFGAAAAL